MGAGSEVLYQRHCMELASGFVWGSFSMAAVVYDRQRLLSRVGLLSEGRTDDEVPYDYAEGQYAVRTGLAGLCTARPHFADACAGAQRAGDLAVQSSDANGDVGGVDSQLVESGA